LLLFILLSIIVSSQEQIRPVSDDAGRFMMVGDGFVYKCSDTLCDGLYIKFYDNGKIRIKGSFNNGVPVDTVKEYYESGVIKYIYYPYKRKYKYDGKEYNYSLFVQYDELGNCIRFVDDKKGVDVKYGQNDVLLSALHYNRRKSDVKYYVEYHPEGGKKMVITKGHRFDYDESGRLRCHWVRKSERRSQKHGVMSATFYFEDYDVTGGISRTGRFYSNSDLYEHDYWLHISPKFPVNLDSVPLQDFREVVHHKLNIKDVYKWDYANNKTIIVRYKQQGDVWLETEKTIVPRVAKVYD